jgi:hypothetical protein
VSQQNQEQRLHICGENSEGKMICFLEIFTPRHEFRITYPVSYSEKKSTHKNKDHAFRYFQRLIRVDSQITISGEEGNECPYHRNRLHIYGEDDDGNKYCLREHFNPHAYWITRPHLPKSYYDKRDNALRYFRLLTRIDSRCHIVDQNGEVCPCPH